MASFWVKLCTVYGKIFILVLFTDKNPMAHNNSLLDYGLCEQYPRFLAARRGMTVHFYCSCGYSCALKHIKRVEWYKGTVNGTEVEVLSKNVHGKMSLPNNSSSITIRKIQPADNGIYYCRFHTFMGNSTSLCGTELKVMGGGSIENIKTRNTMKDAIIMIQTILIVLFVAVPMLLIIDKNNKPAPIEDDHTYEGLQIEQATTYEDIITLRSPDEKWTVGEHPCQE